MPAEEGLRQQRPPGPPTRPVAAGRRAGPTSSRRPGRQRPCRRRTFRGPPPRTAPPRPRRSPPRQPGNSPRAFPSFVPSATTRPTARSASKARIVSGNFRPAIQRRNRWNALPAALAEGLREDCEDDLPCSLHERARRQPHGVPSARPAAIPMPSPRGRRREDPRSKFRSRVRQQHESSATPLFHPHPPHAGSERSNISMQV